MSTVAEQALNTEIKTTFADLRNAKGKSLTCWEIAPRLHTVLDKILKVDSRKHFDLVFSASDVTIRPKTNHGRKIWADLTKPDFIAEKVDAKADAK